MKLITYLYVDMLRESNSLTQIIFNIYNSAKIISMERTSLQCSFIQKKAPKHGWLKEKKMEIWQKEIS